MTIEDPVHKVRYAFEPKGADLIVDCWIEPGGGLPEHLHPRQEERWSAVEGEVALKLDGETRPLRPADGEALVRPGVKHALENRGDSEVHLRCYVTPALGLETFLTESASAARDGLIMRGGIPRGLKGARWAARFLATYEDDVVMTFPPRFVQRTLIATLGR